MSQTPSPSALTALLAAAEGRPEAMLQVAAHLRKQGRGEEALAVAHRAIALAPADPRIAVLGRAFLSAGVPRWHFALVRDEVRNAAYDAALRRAITPATRVLEIGTGTGLLAMMAARAGAKEVISCEMNPAVAETARAIIAKNGYVGRVRVVTGHSDTLDAERDLGGRMDLLVSEIVSNDLLSEDVLPAHERAVRDLLKPDAPVIPARGRIRVALAQDLDTAHAPVATVDGFDLSDMEAWRAPSRQVTNRAGQIALRSAPADLFDFDFATARHAEPQTRQVVCRASGGEANGILQWIHLTLDANTAYENALGTPQRACWDLRFYPLAEPVATRAGDEIAVHGLHDRKHVQVWLDRR